MAFNRARRFGSAKTMAPSFCRSTKSVRSEDAPAKFAHHLIIGGAAGFDHLMRDFVGFQHAAAEFAKHRDHRGFPGGDSSGQADAQHQGLAAATPVKLLGRRLSAPSPQARRLHRVAHQHGNSERTHAARHGSDRSGHFRDARMNVAYQHRTFFTKLRELRGEIRKDSLRFRAHR